MKSSIFKVLAVMVMVGSVTFMGASIAAYYGHPEPTSEMSSPQLQDYTFERNPGENPTWTVILRVGPNKGNVGSPAKTPYEAIVTAHKDLENRMRQEATAASTELQRLKDPAGELATFTTNQQQDEQAMEARIAELQQLSVRYQADLLKKSEELQALSVESKKIRDETAKRRTDVVRLHNELEEARTDQFRLTEQIRTLTDQLVRLQLDNQALTDRQKQLEEQVTP